MIYMVPCSKCGCKVVEEYRGIASGWYWWKCDGCTNASRPVENREKAAEEWNRENADPEGGSR